MRSSYSTLDAVREDQAGNGIVTLASEHSVDETVSRLEKLLASKAVKSFAIVDHSGEAKKAGLSMPNTKLILFGNPQAGTPLMLSTPEIAIDLPLKILIREDKAGKVWVSYNDPEFLRKRHNLSSDLAQTPAAAGSLAQGIAH